MKLVSLALALAVLAAPPPQESPPNEGVLGRMETNVEMNIEKAPTAEIQVVVADVPEVTFQLNRASRNIDVSVLLVREGSETMTGEFPRYLSRNNLKGHVISSAKRAARPPSHNLPDARRSSV